MNNITGVTDITEMFIQEKTPIKETQKPVNQHKINPNIKKIFDVFLRVLAILLIIPLVPIALGTIIILSPIVISVTLGKIGFKLLKNSSKIKKIFSKFKAKK